MMALNPPRTAQPSPLLVLGGAEFEFTNAVYLFLQLAVRGAIWGNVCYTIAHHILVNTEDTWKVRGVVWCVGVGGC